MVLALLTSVATSIGVLVKAFPGAAHHFGKMQAIPAVIANEIFYTVLNPKAWYSMYQSWKQKRQRERILSEIYRRIPHMVVYFIVLLGLCEFLPLHTSLNIIMTSIAIHVAIATTHVFPFHFPPGYLDHMEITTLCVRILSRHMVNTTVTVMVLSAAIPLQKGLLLAFIFLIYVCKMSDAAMKKFEESQQCLRNNQDTLEAVLQMGLVRPLRNEIDRIAPDTGDEYPIESHQLSTLITSHYKPWVAGEILTEVHNRHGDRGRRNKVVFRILKKNEFSALSYMRSVNDQVPRENGSGVPVPQCPTFLNEMFRLFTSEVDAPVDAFRQECQLYFDKSLQSKQSRRQLKELNKHLSTFFHGIKKEDLGYLQSYTRKCIEFHPELTTDTYHMLVAHSDTQIEEFCLSYLEFSITSTASGSTFKTKWLKKILLSAATVRIFYSEDEMRRLDFVNSDSTDSF